ncbi:hypothetical protein INF35_11400 [Subdoligranulum sp. DSM 109015]|uniref:Uncharacterized protein n=1 Tax=Gemmiger gallinarum TaxID=2779354 RepID=A0ABR9R5F7_9FIRM|nr:hypothetical protein [Gemmiger gallinarum]MBE5038393.1 hypothetical protein [Gemmiger gallinarum]
MKLHHRVLALGMAAVMALALTACSPKKVAQDMVIGMVQALGFTTADEEEDEATETMATEGGSITYPEGFDASGTNALLQDGTLYLSFKDMQYYSTDFFTPAGDTVTVTSYGSIDATTSYTAYKVALWELSEDGTTTSYVAGSTIYFTISSDETCYTYDIGGLTPGKKYKARVSFDSTVARVTGGMTISGLTDDALVQTEDDDT